MSVTLATTPHSNWQQLAPLWNALGCAPADDTNPEGWYVGKHQLPDGKLLLAYTSPEQAVVNAMEAGTPPAQALQKWQGDAQVLLNIAKRERKRSVLINLELAAEHLNLVAESVSYHWHQPVAGFDLVASEASDADSVNPQYQLLAALTVAKTASAQSVMAKLDASALKLKGAKQTRLALQSVDSLYLVLATSEPGREQMLAAEAELEQLQKNHAEVTAKLEQQNELLNGQLQQVQEELESRLVVSKQQHARATELEGALKAAQADKKVLKSEADKSAKALSKAKDEVTAQKTKQKENDSAKKELKLALDMAEKENTALLEQLHLVQDELEWALRSKKDQDAAISEQKSSVEKLKGELKSITEELTVVSKARVSLEKGQTKLTAEKATLVNQVSALKNTVKVQGDDCTALKNENQQLLEQIHLVQEELERKVSQASEQVRTAQQQHQKTTIELEDAQGKLAESRQTIGKLEMELGVAAERYNNLNDEHSSLVKEHSLLERRLLKLREGMETLERTNKALNGNLAEVKNALAVNKKQMAEQREASEKDEKQSTLALAFANNRIKELNHELNSVIRSKTWKLANPLNGHAKKSGAIRKKKLEEQASEIATSGLFDQAWYLTTYPEVAQSTLSPIEHYLQTGAYEGYNPSYSFDTLWYLSTYQDVVDSGLNPLVHYIRFGKQEERAPTPGSIASLPAPIKSENTDSERP